MKLFIVFILFFTHQILCFDFLNIFNNKNSSIAENEKLFVSALNNSQFINKYLKNLTKNHREVLNQKTEGSAPDFGSNNAFSSSSSNSKESIIQNCVSSTSLKKSISAQVNEEIKRCSTIVLAEYMNVITNSYNDVQVFMKFPGIIWRDIEKCGLNDTCKVQIVADAVQESAQIPPRVFSLTSKIQNLVLRTITSIDNCAIDGLKKIAGTGSALVQQVFYCIFEETSKINCGKGPN